MKITASLFIVIVVLVLGCSTPRQPEDCMEAAQGSNLPDQYVDMVERAGELDPLQRMALQGALETAGLDQICSAALQSNADGRSNTQAIGAVADQPKDDAPDRGTPAASSDVTGGTPTIQNVRKQSENHGGIQADQDSAGSMDNSMMPGRLPPDLVEGTLKSGSSLPIIDPDGFRHLVAGLSGNSLQAKSQYGKDRVLVSNWIDGIRGVDQPVLVWDEDKLCLLENDAANIEAITKTNPGGEILISGYIDYEAATKGSPFLLTDCRIHGYYDVGYHHAIVGSSEQ